MSLYADKTHQNLGGGSFLAVRQVWYRIECFCERVFVSGKWWYGGLIGLMAILIRVVNPAYPEGIMLAILFGNVMAPLIDYFLRGHVAAETVVRREDDAPGGDDPEASADRQGVQA